MSSWIMVMHLGCACSLALYRKQEKEEEKRAREKIRQKLEEDKVLQPGHSVVFLFLVC